VDVRIYRDLGVVVSYYKWGQYEGYMTDVWIRRARRWQLLVSSADVLPQYR
jgi:hypothetical protein